MADFEVAPTTEDLKGAELSEAERREVEHTKSSDTIKVSTNRSLFFYVDLATNFLQDQDTVKLSALGFAITTAVTIAEILKGQEVVIIKNIKSSMTNVPERRSQKPKIEIVLSKSPKFREIAAKKKLVSLENKEIRDALAEGRSKMQDRLKKEEQERKH